MYLRCLTCYLKGVTIFVHDDINAARQTHRIDILIGGSYLASENIIDVNPISCGIHFLNAFRRIESDRDVIYATVDEIGHYVFHRQDITGGKIDCLSGCRRDSSLGIRQSNYRLCIDEVYIRIFVTIDADLNRIIALVNLSGNTVQRETGDLDGRNEYRWLRAQQIGNDSVQRFSPASGERTGR